MKTPNNTRPNTCRMPRGSLLGLALVLGGIAHADGAVQSAPSAVGTAQSAATVAAERRVGAELRALMVELIQSGAIGRDGRDLAMQVDSPAQRVSDLGLLVDSARSGDDGVHVLGVTPGGAAERFGLRAGDVVVAANGSSLVGTSGAGTLRSVVDAVPDGGPLSLRVQREGAFKDLSGDLAGVYLPAMHLTVGSGVQIAAQGSSASGGTSTAGSGCGRISDFDSAPRQQDLHDARIILIDGVTPGPTSVTSYRVGVGRHEVTVGENIQQRYLGFSSRFRDSGPDFDRYKVLTVDVAPDTTTLIAAHLINERRNEWKNGAYWEPVAWKQVAEACR